MRRKALLLTLAALTALPLTHAQKALNDIRRDITLSASNYVCYRGSEAPAPTPAPKGYKPFYISTYARHGSRWLIAPNDYASPSRKMHRADSLGLLTAKGRQVMHIIDNIKARSEGRLGELTDIGAEQHRGIGQRLMQRWPEVFSGKAFIEARSTPVIRCIFSMENELWSLKQANPALDVRTDASEADWWYLNCQGSKARRTLMTNEQYQAGMAVLDKFNKAHQSEYDAMDQRLARQLFTDVEKASEVVKVADLRDQLFSLANNMQSHSFTIEGGHATAYPVFKADWNLYPLFTADELHLLWQRDNWLWYINYGHAPVTGEGGAFSQTNLLRDFIAAADSCLAMPPAKANTRHHAATLRFGHETCVLPLTCLMELGNAGYRATDPDDLEQHWRNYEIFTMASNVQLIFFRSPKAGAPILVKALLNEAEISIGPLKPYSPGCYLWSDVKAFWTAKLAGK